MKKNNNQVHRSVFRTIISIAIVPLVIFLILLFMPNPTYKDGFKTLEQLDAYGKTIPENFKIDTENTIKPDFGTYYNTLKPTWTSNLIAKTRWLLSFIKLSNPPLWSASFFKEQLITLTKQRQAHDFKDNFICKLLPTLQSKIIIFGNVQGAFHSLIRCLQKIKELGIIDNTLKITSPDNFIIFTGDIISRSPYTMETLSLVMALLSVNPDNVIYLRGNHESGNYWQEHTLKTELQIRAASLSQEIVPLADEVNKFFNTLPLACYVSMLSDTGTEFIRISDSGRGQNELLNEHAYAKFLTSKILQRLSSFNLKDVANQDAGDSPIDIKVIFKGEKKREVYQPHEGLRLLSPDLESTAWTILSCPTPVYQKAIKFMYDAFVLLSPAKNIDEWKITLYNRNVQTSDPFKATSFNLLSGVEDGAAPADKKITPAGFEQSKPQNSQPSTAPRKTSELATQPATQKITESAPADSQLKPIKPLPVATSEQSLDTTSTATIAQDIQAMNQHIQALTQYTEAIAKKLKNQTQPTPQSQPEKAVQSEPKSSPATTEDESGFEPIKPQPKDV